MTTEEAAEPIFDEEPRRRLEDDRFARIALPIGRSGWAIIAGYLGLFAVLIVPAPAAVLAGILALRDIRRNPKLGGKGRAIFGIVMGIPGTVLLLVLGGAFVYRTWIAPPPDAFTQSTPVPVSPELPAFVPPLPSPAPT